MKSKQVGIGVSIFTVVSLLAVLIGFLCRNSCKEKRYFTVR